MPLNLRRCRALALSFSLLSTPGLSQVSVAQDSKVVIPAATVASVTVRNLRSHIHVDGTVVAREIVEIFPQISNTRIDQVLVDVGDRVDNGEVLLRLDKRRLRSEKDKTEANIVHMRATVEKSKGQIKAARTAYAAAQAALARTETLVQKGTVSVATLDQARTQDANAESALETAEDALLVANAELSRALADDNLAKLNLEYTTVTAHSAGVIAERNAVVGGTAKMEGTPLFRIIRWGDLEVEVQVFETSFLAIDVGDDASFKIAGQHQISGQVRQKQPVVDKLTRMGRIRIAVPEHENVQIGLSAHGTILTENRDGLTVPATAVSTDETGEFVHKVVDGIVRKQSVTTGILFAGAIEIRSGLSEGEIVLARAGAFFRDGDAVRPVMAEDGAETQKSAHK